MLGCSAVGDPELVSVKARVVRQKRPRHLREVGLEPDAASEAKVHDRIGDLTRCRVGHHPFNPPESVAVGGVYGRTLGIVAGDQPAVFTDIAGCRSSKALLGAHSMLLRHSPSRTFAHAGCRFSRASPSEGRHEVTAGCLPNTYLALRFLHCEKLPRNA